MQLTRRALLTVASGLVLSGCRPKRRGSPRPAAADTTAVRDALTAEHDLIASYDLAIARLDAVAATALVRARERHRAHVAALTPRLPSPPAAVGSPAAAPSAAVRESLRQSVQALQTSAGSEPDGTTAALLASIAAEHAADLANRADA